MVRIKRLWYVEEIQKFVAAFSKQIEYEIPYQYFLDEEVWAMMQGSKIVGGFAFVSKKVPRSLAQIPGSFVHNRQLYTDKQVIDLPSVAEVTGYWMAQKRGALIFTLWFVLRAFLHRASYFVYSYPVSQKKLGYYYSTAKPLVLYRGVAKKLPGHPEEMEAESVEMITAFGVLKIFLHRVGKVLRRIGR